MGPLNETQSLLLKKLQIGGKDSWQHEPLRHQIFSYNQFTNNSEADFQAVTGFADIYKGTNECLSFSETFSVLKKTTNP